jgi:hypothetical protein
MRRLLMSLAIVAIASFEIGSAASATFTAGRLGAATTAVPRCTAAGLGVVQSLSGSNVATITVSGLPAACGGASLVATVNNGSVNSSGSGTVPAGGGSVTVTFSVPPAVAAIEQTDIVLVGP